MTSAHVACRMRQRARSIPQASFRPPWMGPLSRMAPKTKPGRRQNWTTLWRPIGRSLHGRGSPPSLAHTSRAFLACPRPPTSRWRGRGPLAPAQPSRPPPPSPSATREIRGQPLKVLLVCWLEHSRFLRYRVECTTFQQCMSSGKLSNGLFDHSL